MASVWKRLQRVNKRAAKFQYTASYHRVDLETSPKWTPNKLSIVWTRRSRRVVTEPYKWEPSLKDPLIGSVIYPAPENQTVTVTLFKDSRTNELEDKDWTFVLEDVSSTGKRRRVASCSINMRKFASLEPAQRSLVLRLEPLTRKVCAAALHLTLHAVLLREGHATDDDMQSLASLLSVNNNSDIAVLEDLDEDDYTLSDHSTRQMSDLRQQMEELTASLSCSSAATPASVQSLKFDSSPASPAPAPAPARASPSPPPPASPKTSTPIDKMDNFKEIVFKPKTITKRNLKPLELKTNLSSLALDRNDNERDDDLTPTADRLLAYDKDKTPVQDLLEWVQLVTREYRCVKVTNLTTSFRSGLAFCAIVHHHRPDLIDFSGLQPGASEHNVRAALAASAALGVSPVLSAADVCAPAPDRLAIMTYLFQLRAHFTGSELQVEQLGNEETESSYLVGRHDTDEALPRDLFSREITARRSRNIIPRAASPTSDKRTRGSLVQQSKQILGRVLAPDKASKPTAHWFDQPDADQSPPLRPEKLMTRKELTDPFGSDEEDEEKNIPPANVGQGEGAPSSPVPSPLPSPLAPPLSPFTEQPVTIPDSCHETTDSHVDSPTEQPKSPTTELPKPAPQLLSRHDELKERARQLLESARREASDKARDKRQREQDAEEKENALRNGDVSPKKPMTDEERQAMLKERARKLIADARAGIVSGSPLSPSRARPSLEIISKHSVMEEFAAAGGMEQLDALLSRDASSPTSRKSLSPDRSDGSCSEAAAGARSPLHSFSALVERLTPDKEAAPDTEPAEGGSYIQSEVLALEREQRAVDRRAAALETQLRHVMDTPGNDQEEAHLMSQWFNLVNKKNALLRRQMQLNILEQEEDLSRRCELLARELRLSLGVDDWRKTPQQKRRERLLLQELLSAVNERDRLVQEMDEQEKAIADDDEIERNISQVDINRKQNCSIQ